MLDLLLQAHKRPPSHSFTSYLRHLGAAGLFFVAVIDSAPIPTFGGPDILVAILSASHSNLWYEYAGTAVTGSVLGAYITFRLARKAGSAYLDKKFKKSKLGKFHTLFKKWGTGTLAASTAIPLPTPTSMFFAAAGASDYPRTQFLIVVTVCRVFRYCGIALLAAHYGRHFLRVLRHPIQYWPWMLAFVALTAALIIGGIIANRRLETATAK
ncbi:MAG: VTT domain-containing protein [Candidatus Sulfotelmatobacter sp.]